MIDIYELAYDSMGVYPAENNGVKRSEWQEGFNAYGKELLEKVIVINKYLDNLSYRQYLSLSYLKNKDYICFYIKDENICLTISLNDTFGYACYDYEDVDITELELLEDLDTYYDYDGIVAWAGIKRGADPIKERQTERWKNACQYIKEKVKI